MDGYNVEVLDAYKYDSCGYFILTMNIFQLYLLAKVFNLWVIYKGEMNLINRSPLLDE